MHSRRCLRYLAVGGHGRWCRNAKKGDAPASMSDDGRADKIDRKLIIRLVTRHHLAHRFKLRIWNSTIQCDQRIMSWMRWCPLCRRLSQRSISTMYNNSDELHIYNGPEYALLWAFRGLVIAPLCRQVFMDLSSMLIYLSIWQCVSVLYL